MQVRWDGDDNVVKVVMLGDSGVGKSSVALRFVEDEFHPYIESTIGASYLSKSIQIIEQNPILSTRKVTYRIWDTAGQEKFHSLVPMYYRGAGVAILVFDVTKPHTIESLNRWVEELRTNGPPKMILALCGNKADLTGDRLISELEGKHYADEIGAIYVEVSAKESLNVDDLFQRIGASVLAHNDASETVCSAFPTCGISDSLEGDDSTNNLFKGCC
jgi:small GTP-binding protein